MTELTRGKAGWSAGQKTCAGVRKVPAASVLALAALAVTVVVAVPAAAQSAVGSGVTTATAGTSAAISAAGSVTKSADSLPSIKPGDPLLDADRIGSDTIQYSLTVYRENSRVPVGRLTDELLRDSSSGKVVLRRVRTVTSQSSRIIDSTTTDAQSLEPLWHRSIQPTRLVSVEFQGKKIRGTLGPVNAPPVRVDTTLSETVFDSGNWDLLLRTIPLTKGFAARFDAWDAELGPSTYRIAVTGSAVVQGEDAHVVVFKMTRNRDSVVWIGKESGVILRIETMLGRSIMLQQERIIKAPSPSQ